MKTLDEETNFIFKGSKIKRPLTQMHHPHELMEEFTSIPEQQHFLTDRPSHEIPVSSFFRQANLPVGTDLKEIKRELRKLNYEIDIRKKRTDEDFPVPLPSADKHRFGRKFRGEWIGAKEFRIVDNKDKKIVVTSTEQTRKYRLGFFNQKKWEEGPYDISKGKLVGDVKLFTVPKGNFACGRKSQKPVIFGEGIHVINDPLLELSLTHMGSQLALYETHKAYFNKGSLHILKVPENTYQFVLEDRVPKIFGPGTYYFESKDFSVQKTFPQTKQAYHFVNQHIYHVEANKVLHLKMNGKNIPLMPGDYHFTARSCQSVTEYTLDECPHIKIGDWHRFKLNANQFALVSIHGKLALMNSQSIITEEGQVENLGAYKPHRKGHVFQMSDTELKYKGLVNAGLKTVRTSLCDFDTLDNHHLNVKLSIKYKSTNLQKLLKHGTKAISHINKLIKATIIEETKTLIREQRAEDILAPALLEFLNISFKAKIESECGIKIQEIRLSEFLLPDCIARLNQKKGQIKREDELKELVHRSHVAGLTLEQEALAKEFEGETLTAKHEAKITMIQASSKAESEDVIEQKRLARRLKEEQGDAEVKIMQERSKAELLGETYGQMHLYQAQKAPQMVVKDSDKQIIKLVNDTAEKLKV